jgi:hypothetical protein
LHGGSDGFVETVQSDKRDLVKQNMLCTHEHIVSIQLDDKGKKMDQVKENQNQHLKKQYNTYGGTQRLDCEFVKHHSSNVHCHTPLFRG